MATAIRPIGHEDRLSLVDHLDELRTPADHLRGGAGVAFGVCFWQNHELLHILNKPLQTQTKKQVAKGEGTVGQAVLAQQAIVLKPPTTRSARAAARSRRRRAASRRDARAAAAGADRAR